MKQFLLSIPFLLLTSFLNAQQKVRLQGHIPDSPNQMVCIASKNNPLDVTILTKVQTDSVGSFTAIIEIDKPHSLALFMEEFIFPRQADFCEFWASQGDIQVDITLYNDAVFMGINQKANNLLADLKKARNLADRFLAEFEYQSDQGSTAANYYLARIDSMKIRFVTDYEMNFQKTEPVLVDKWLATEVKSFGITERLNLYQKLSQKDSTWFDKSQLLLVLDSVRQTLVTFPDSTIQSERFVQAIRDYSFLVMDQYVDTRAKDPEYKALLKQLSSTSRSNDLIDMTYQEDASLNIWWSRKVLRHISQLFADKPSIVEFFMASTIYSLGSRANVLLEQKRILSQLKKDFPRSVYIPDLEETLIRYKAVQKEYDNK